MAHDVESSSLGGGKPSSIISVGTHSRAWLPGARSEDVAKAISGLKEYRRLRTMKASCSSSRLRPVPGIVDRLWNVTRGLPVHQRSDRFGLKRMGQGEKDPLPPGAGIALGEGN